MTRVLTSVLQAVQPLVGTKPKSVLKKKALTDFDFESFFHNLTKKPWYFGAVAYQIYPRSFYDSDGDGVGDLKGITAKLDYLAGRSQSLGVDAIWLSPFYTSPMADFGYDIANYYEVDPIFGTLTDFKELTDEAHHRNLKILIDLVPNHTSSTHPWFEQSCSSKNNPKREWYVWRDPEPNGDPPNNWRSAFGGSAWKYEPLTQQYYLHSFTEEQPDLNWDNPQVRQAMKDVIKFWLELGVDGFRVDAVSWLSKDSQLRDDPPAQNYRGEASDYDALEHIFSRSGPKLCQYLHEMTEVLEGYKDAFMVLEAYPEETHQTASKYLQFYECINPTRSSPFNFEGINLPWDAEAFKYFIDEFQSILKPNYLPIYTLGNHDKHRLATRIGQPAARTAAMMLLTLPGMPFIYYGEEIGMVDVDLPLKFQKDPDRLEHWARDMARTPMQWSGQTNGGFTTGQAWLPVGNNYQKVNIEDSLKDKKSLLSLYRELIKMRRGSEVLKHGSYHSLNLAQGLYGFSRVLGSKEAVIVLNFTDQATALEAGVKGTVKLSTYMDTREEDLSDVVKLRPNEGLIIEID